MPEITGIHHITAIASDSQANLDFYRLALGQRLVKTTVNFDNPNIYHFYYGDAAGSPGTILTFFPWRRARRGRRGGGEASAVAYRVPPAAFDYWHARLQKYGIDQLDGETRFGSQVLAFDDPDGLRLELIEDAAPAQVQPWEHSPVPLEHALNGFHSLTLRLADTERTLKLLSEQFGYRMVGQEGPRYRLQAAGEAHTAGLFLDLLHDPQALPAKLGAGSVHHLALRTANDDAQAQFQGQLRRSGFGVTPVRDRLYFRSIYFNGPGGVLFEIATDEPGFTVDEPAGELGASLRLPPWLEARREEIEAGLPAVELGLQAGR